MLKYKRILVVEDEALLALSIEDVLIDARAEVVWRAGSVQEALTLIDTILSQGIISAAVLDVNLGGEMVWPVADVLRGHAVPFVLHTAYQDLVTDPRQAALYKPCSLNLLVEVVSTLINQPGVTLRKHDYQFFS